MAATDPDERRKPVEPAAPDASAAERVTPGERPSSGAGSAGGRLARPPSTRYAPRPARDAEPPTPALRGPLVTALFIASVGAAALVAVGAIFASTTGLLFVSGVTGAGVGLVLARAAVPRDDPRAVPRRTLAWLAMGLAIGAIVVADLATWLIARQEGGTLGLLDYLFTTFGPFVPGELLLAAVAAWWGASSGPVQS